MATFAEDFLEERSIPKGAGWVTFINSTIFFILAAMTVTFLHEVYTAVVALILGYDPVMVRSCRSSAARKRRAPAMLDDFFTRALIAGAGVALAAGPLGCLVTGFFFFSLYHAFSRRPGLLKLFLLWLAIHGFNYFLAKWVSAFFIYSGFGVIAAWFYLSKKVQIFLSLLAIGPLFYLGVVISRHFLKMAIRRAMTSGKERHKFLLQVAVLPWFFGSMIVYGINEPMNNITSLFIPICSGVIVLIALLFSRQLDERQTRIVRVDKDPGIAWPAIAVLAAALFAVRLIIYSGIPL